MQVANLFPNHHFLSVEATVVTNSDDPKFDDYQNPDEELDINMFFEDDEKFDNAVEEDSIVPDLSDEEFAIELDFPDESVLGENTATFADELDMFADLESQVTEVSAMAEILEPEQVPAFDLEETVEVNEVTEDEIASPLDNWDDLTAATVDGEMPLEIEEFAEESDLSEETEEIFDDLEAVVQTVEQEEMIVNPVLAAIEDIPVVEDKKTKKAREKAEKTHAKAQANAAKAQAKAQAKADKVAKKTQAKAGNVQATTTEGNVPVVEDKKAKKAREKAEKSQAIAQAKADKVAEKAQAKADKAAGKSPKEKPPKAKREKKPKEPGDKQPQNTAALAFMAGLVLMLLAFGGVNVYAVVKHGIGGAMIFLIIFDVLAAIATGIALVLRRSKDAVNATDVSMGIAAISLIVGCMFILANLAYNLN